AAFQNLRSWLKPDGRFAFAVWGAPANNPWMGIVRETVAQFIDLPQPEPDQPGPFRYADAEAFVALLTSAGFHKVKVQTWSGRLQLGGGLPAPDAADFGLSAFSIGQKLKPDSPERSQALEQLSNALSDHEKAGVVSMQAEVHIVTGRVT
ncbi:MAG: class I SAM-dependent methyltransferase, partial [Pseudomonadota bacterium]